MSLLTRYVLKEIVPSYLLGLGFLSVIMFVIELFKLIVLFVEKNTSLAQIAQLLLFYLPLIFQFTLPVAAILGAMLAVGRFSEDQELVAWNACGVSLWKVFAPVFAFGIALACATLLFYEFVFPLSVDNYMKVKLELLQGNPLAEFENTHSYKTRDGVRISIGSIKAQSLELERVHIYSRKQNTLVFAPRALLLEYDVARNAFPLIVMHGTLQPGNLFEWAHTHFYEQLSARQIFYIPNDFAEVVPPFRYQNLSLSDLARNVDDRVIDHVLYILEQTNHLAFMNIRYHKAQRDMDDFLNHNQAQKPRKQSLYNDALFQHTLALKKARITQRRFFNQLNYYIQSGGEFLVNNVRYIFQRKIMFACSAVLFTLLGAPLGVFSRRTGKSAGLGLTILFIILFFGLVFLGQFLMKKIDFPVSAAAWGPAFVLGLLGIFFLMRKFGALQRLSMWGRKIFAARRKTAV